MSDEEYVNTLLAEFGIKSGERKVIKDVTGTPLPISEDLLTDRKTGKLKVDKRGRGQFMPLLAQTFLDPDEIWLNWEKEVITLDNGSREPNWVPKRYYIRVIDLGNKLYALGVFTKDKKQWYGSTVFQLNTKNDREAILSALNERRKGILLHKKIPQPMAAFQIEYR